MSVSYLWVGATTSTSATVTGRVSGTVAAVRLVVSHHEDLSSPLHFGPETPSDDHVVTITADGLAPDARYHYAFELAGELDDSVVGRFRTHPVRGEPCDFAIAASSCAGLKPAEPGEGDVAAPGSLSNHEVFDTIVDVDPMMFLHLGDLHYYNIGDGKTVPEHDVATYRGAYNDVFAQPRQHRLYRSVATAYVWDDHDFGPNNSDASAPGRDAACQVYRERVPHYRLADEEGIWQEWKTGRVQFVLLDVRSNRSEDKAEQGPDKTMLGGAQKEWLSDLLGRSTAKFLVLVSGSRWFDPSSDDTWDSFSDERDELIDLFDSTGWKDRMCIVSGDVHAAAIDTGGNAPGGIPVFQFASMDSTPHEVVQDHYDLGPSVPGRNQYGTLRFTDSGDTIKVTGVAYHGANPIMHHWFTIDVD